MGAPKAKQRERTAEEVAAAHAASVARVEAEVAAVRAAGGTVHGCFADESPDTDEGPGEWPTEVMAEVQARAKAFNDAMWEARGGRPDPNMSAWEKNCRLAWAVGVSNGAIPRDEPFVLAPKPEGWKGHEYK